jgi:hypothetical protein
MQIHELTQPRATQLTEVDLIGPNSVFNKARAVASTVKSGAGFKFRDPNNTYQKALDQQYQQAAAKAAAGLRAQGYGVAPTPAPAATTTTAATTPPQAPVTPAPAVATRPNTAGAVYTTPNTAGAIYTRPNTAGAVRPGAAQAIMTQTELNTALRQVNLSRNQIDELAKQLQANPAMAQALLKALGLAK